ncbi:MAG: arginine--tRNA ligase [Firmicutes bacterium]|uniref:Arginine--tRNA ligase n=1 Tax=Melghirimyces thermohalophilus TaxID=1236220 RepID=A0A1G6M6Z8_9BACL|nr:arginine--tRNA ligase [Melghirimyces thermohalophilus]MDA8352221.1 arginine--tRNA ligase [Bacillota bacterium]SDC51342.1 arginyl-tRNA synthetase [Melghirimyces thermohalophilus]
MNTLEQMKEELKQNIGAAVIAAGLASQEELPEVMLEVPRDKSHGDLATNIAMQLARIAKKNPRQIAEEIVEEMNRNKGFIKEVQIAGPGFINFFIDRSSLSKILLEMDQQKDDYGRTDTGAGEKVLVEFVSANPTGSLHLGHARGAAIGDVLCNVLETAGYDVTREYYINDAGNQIHNMTLSLEARYREALGLEAPFPEDGYRGPDIVRLGEKLAREEGDRLEQMEEAERHAFIRQYGLTHLLEKIKEDLGDYRVKFDSWFSEQSLHDSGAVQESVEELTKRGQTYEKEGALWLNSSSFGDDKDRVLVKQDGSYTYITPDIAYHRNKYNRGYGRIVNIFGADHHGYVPRMKAAMAALGYDVDQMTFLITQMVKLYQGGELVKMSKRTGKAITLVDLMEEVGVDATRYIFASRSPDSHLDFDMDLAVSQSNENPVFYVQYAHARINSVFRQAEERGYAVQVDPESLSALQEEPEFDLLQKLAEFPEEIATAARQLAPHRVARYLYDLSTLLHSYYNAHRVIQEDEKLTRARISLLLGVAQVLKNGLRMIGVSAPEKM